MKNIQKFVFALFLVVTVQVSAQEATKPDTITTIKDFQLPTFEQLSNDIATDYTNLLESLPDLSNIGPYIDKEIRRGFPFEHATVYTVRNFSNEHSILPSISPVRFQLRDVLNNIMFTGFDINQLHLNDAYRNAR